MPIDHDHIKNAFRTIVQGLMPQDASIPSIAVSRDVIYNDDNAFRLTMAFSKEVLVDNKDRVRQRFFDSLNEVLVDAGIDIEFGQNNVHVFVVDDNIDKFIKLSKTYQAGKDKLTL